MFSAGEDNGIDWDNGGSGKMQYSLITCNNACLEFVDIPNYGAAGAPESPTGITAFAGTSLDSAVFLH